MTHKVILLQCFAGAKKSTTCFGTVTSELSAKYNYNNLPLPICNFEQTFVSRSVTYNQIHPIGEVLYQYIILILDISDPMNFIPAVNEFN